MLNSILESMLNSISGVDLAKTLAGMPEKQLESSSAGNFVKIKMSTRLKVSDVEIEEEMLSAENKYLLEEMLASTFSDLLEKIVSEASKEIEKTTRKKREDIAGQITPQMLKNATGALSIKDPTGKEVKIDIEGLGGMETLEHIMESFVHPTESDDEDEDKR